MDIQGQYSLLQVFDLTGRAMFGSEWRGTEAIAAPVNGRDDLRESQQRIENRLLRLRQEDRRLGEEVKSNPSEAERKQIGIESAQIWEERDRLRQELNSLPEVSVSSIEDSEAFTRRTIVEKELRNAFRDRDLDLWFYPNEHLSYSELESRPHFGLSFALSIVVFPMRQNYQSRRCAALVSKANVHNWLDRFSGNEAQPGELSPAEKCRVWLRKSAKGKKQMEKAGYRSEALTKFPGLSARAFDRVWADDDTVPTAWKKSGPIG